jgi:hypothetical protein
MFLSNLSYQFFYNFLKGEVEKTFQNICTSKFFPCTRSKAAWDHFVRDFYFILESEVGWGVRVDVWCGENRTTARKLMV